MSTLVGTFSLVRLALRLDRVRIPVWILVTVVTALSTASAYKTLYPDEASRARIAGTIGANPAMLAIYGPVYDSSLGSIVMWRLAIIGALLAGLMSMLTINRHTRADEEAGRLELIGATVVGRHAPMAAALVVTIGADIVLGLLLGLGLAGQGLPAAGSFAAGFAIAGLGIVLAAITAVAAQLSENSRTVTAIAGTVFGVAFILRLIGDANGSAGPSWLTWLSPVGWIEKVRAYADNNWWVLGLMAVTAIALFVVAYALVGRRDLGAGLVPPRPGPAEAGAGLSGPFGLAWRLQRWSMIGWAVGFALMGVTFGSVATGVLDLLKDTPQAVQVLAQLGGADVLIDAFMSVIMGLVALVAAVYAIQATLRLRTEETTYRAEPILATNVGRIHWAVSHLVFAVVGSAIMLAVAGLGAGIAYGAQIGDVGGQIGAVLGNAMVQLPATLVVAGIAMALFGLAPRFVIGSWAALTVFLLLGQLGPALQLPQWLMDVSPFTHVPKLTDQVSAMPLVWLSVVAVILGVAGLAGFRRRDVG